MKGPDCIPMAAALVAVLVLQGQVSAQTTIGEARQMGAGTAVSLQDKVVSRAFDDRYYIQEPDRSAGIAVKLGGRGHAPGTVVHVTGTLALEADELVIVEAAEEVGEVGEPPAPLYMSGQAAVDDLSEGLLVTVWGRVVAIGFGPVFRIDDGTGISDSGGNPGLRVYRKGAFGPPAPGSYVRVTGTRGKILGSFGQMPIVYIATADEIVPID